MTATRITITDKGCSEPIILNPKARGTYRITVPDGVTVDYGVELTLDKIGPGQIPDWWPDDDVPEGTEGSATGFIDHPASGIRLTIDHLSGGPITLTVLQDD